MFARPDCLATPSAAALPQGDAWSVHFLADQATEEIVLRIDQAVVEVLVMARAIKSMRIARALVHAHEAGIHVGIVLDRIGAREPRSLAEFLSVSGLTVLVDSWHRALRIDAVIIDHESLLTGSFEYDEPMAYADDLLSMQFPSAARQYARLFAHHASHSVPFEK